MRSDILRKQLPTTSSGITNLLLKRELGLASPSIVQRRCYQYITPNATVWSSNRPQCFFKKFTRDGKHLLCFSRSLSSIELYSVKTIVPQDPAGFHDFFQLGKVIDVALEESEKLCADFLLETLDDQYFIVATKKPVVGFPLKCFEKARRYALLEYVDVVENITFHVIRRSTGDIVDTLSFPHDVISLEHNAGVYLHEELFCVLSLLNQNVHIFHLTKNGLLVRAHKIGTNCFDDDELLQAHQEEEFKRWKKQATGPRLKSEEEVGEYAADSPFLDGLKHRFLVFMYRRSIGEIPSEPDMLRYSPRPNPRMDMDEFMDGDEEDGREDGPGSESREGRERSSRKDASLNEEENNPARRAAAFYRYFPLYASLVMLKVQFLERNILLIRCGAPYSIQGLIKAHKWENSNSAHCFFIVYDISSAKIIEVFDNASEFWADTFINFYDDFRQDLAGRGSNVSSPSNCEFVLEALNRHRNYFTKPKFYPVQANRRILRSLPLSPQLENESPYLDASLFRYDLKILASNTQRRIANEFAVKFFDRETGDFRFKVVSGLAKYSKRQASYIFHPYYPLVLALQQTAMHTYCFNIHYHRGTHAGPDQPGEDRPAES